MKSKKKVFVPTFTTKNGKIVTREPVKPGRKMGHDEAMKYVFTTYDETFRLLAKH